VLGYPDIFHAGDHCPGIMRHKPIGLEGFDDEMVDLMQERGFIPTSLSCFLKDAGG